MNEWAVRKKHYEEIQTIFRRLGFVDGHGRVRKFVGYLFSPALEKSGHTSAELEKCQCWRERFSHRRVTGHP